MGKFEAQHNGSIFQGDFPVRERLLRAVILQTGMDLSGYKNSILQQKVLGRIEFLGLKDHKTYVSLVERDKDECDALIHSMCVSVTKFFETQMFFQ